MILELRGDGKAVVQDTQQVWPLDHPEKKENITTKYEGTWQLTDDAVLDLTFPAEAAPPLFRGGWYRVAFESGSLTFHLLDGATILDHPSWVRQE